MSGQHKTVYVNDEPIRICFASAEVQHFVHAYDGDLYLALKRGQA